MFSWKTKHINYSLTFRGCQLIIAWSLLLLACSGQSQQIRSARLYALDSLLSGQANYLASHHATVNKITMLGDSNDKVTLTPIDTVAWKKELEIFQIIDAINKPVNRDRYKVDFRADVKSNLTVKSFTTNEDLPVRYVRFYFQQLPSRIRKIEAEYKESNGLYRSAKVLTMQFEQIRDTAVLTTYSIQGGQKMFLDDSVQYDIKAVLTLRK